MLALAASPTSCGDEDPNQESAAPEPRCQTGESGQVCVSARGAGSESAATAGDGAPEGDGADPSTSSSSLRSNGGVETQGGAGEGTANGGNAAEGAGTGACRTVEGILRDFKRGDLPGGHPDFETIQSDGEKGMVAPTLGADGLPTLANTTSPSVSSPQSFAQWYADIEELNQVFDVRIDLAAVDGVSVFGSQEFFPLDERGWGSEGLAHNFGFTTELHTRFLYSGDGGTFTFSGDDDLWVFINGRLAIDLGGVHAMQTATLDLAARAEELGLSPGETYPLDLFHAERHSVDSTFEVITDFTLVGCR